MDMLNVLKKPVTMSNTIIANSTTTQDLLHLHEKAVTILRLRQAILEKPLTANRDTLQKLTEQYCKISQQIFFITINS